MQYNYPAILRVATIEGCLVNYCIIIISFPAVKQTFLNVFTFLLQLQIHALTNPIVYQDMIVRICLEILEEQHAYHVSKLTIQTLNSTFKKPFAKLKKSLLQWNPVTQTRKTLIP